MRFWRRSRQSQSYSTFQEQSSAAQFNSVVGNVRWNPFYVIGSRQYCPSRSGLNLMVPKCLSLVSHSDILQGQRVENFSSECWLQNHLHQFAHSSTQCTQQNLDSMGTVEEEVDDDSPVGSQAGTERNSAPSVNSFDLDNEDDDSEDNFSLLRRLSANLYGYTTAVELPPYQASDIPPPTYEEAIANDRDRLSISSNSSDIAFLW